jgi:hypothetical protein
MREAEEDWGEKRWARLRRRMLETRRFPAPWTSEDHNDACFIIKDANGVAVAYVYFEERAAAKPLAVGLGALSFRLQW